MKNLFLAIAVTATLLTGITHAQDSYQPLVYHDEDSTGIGAGKHIVFLAGDHEYRSEETCPAMARMLAKRFGFKCTVLFNIDEEGYIIPGNNNMPGMEAIDLADLVFVFLRFQNFPDKQMQHLVDYLDKGGPIVGLRTSTHAFKIPADSKFAKFDCEFKGEDYVGGFGRQVLGETWAGHYGKNHVMSTRHDIIESAKDHPVLRGVKKPWAQCGGYWTDPMPNSVVLTNSQPLQGMTSDSPNAKDKKPCPGTWVRTYTSKSGTEGRVFTSTSGASEDILDDDYRRMLVNGCLWTMGLEEKITADADVALVGPYNPVTYNNLAYRLDVKPQEMAGWDSPIMPADKEVQPKVKWGQPRPEREHSSNETSPKWTKEQLIAYEKEKWEKHGWPWDEDKVVAIFDEMDVDKNGLADGQERKDWYAKREAEVGNEK